MAYSYDTATCLHLDQVAKFFRLNMLNFNDLDISPCLPNAFIDRRCARFAQWPHQTSGFMSMEDIAYYLKMAEDTVQAYLPYDICNGFSSSIIEVPTHYSGAFIPMLLSGMKLVSNRKCISEFGIAKKELLSTTVDIVRFDSSSGLFDPDNYSEFFTATFILPVDTDMSNLQYMYVTHPAYEGEKHRRIPVYVNSYDTNTRELIVRGSSHNLVQLLYIFDASYTRTRSIDVCDDDIFETTLELWVEGADTCAPYAYLLCDEASIPLRFDIFDKDDGILQYKGYGAVDELGCLIDSDCPTYAGCLTNCNKLQVFYRSGNYCNCNKLLNCQLGNTMCTQLEKAILTLLADLLPSSDCQDCSPLLSQLEYWQTDFALKSQNASYSVPFGLMDNPFGTTRGATTAWGIVKELQNASCNAPLIWTNNI